MTNVDSLRSAWGPALRTAGFLAMLSAHLPSGVYKSGAVRNEAEREFLVRQPDAMPYRSDYTLGWQSSPLVRCFSEASLTSDGIAGVAVRRSSGFEVDLLSWSAACLVAGILVVWVARNKRFGAVSGLDTERV